jgi:peptidoglycan DL-endopeptidase CwlO
VASLNELSRQAEQLSETVLNAQPDLDKKLQLLSQADKKHADDLARLDATKTQLAAYQHAVDEFVAAVYMGGQSDGLNAILSVASPTSLIDQLAIQRVVATEMSEQMQGLHRVNNAAQIVEAASAKSAADAKAAADAAVAVRADLQNKQAELRTQIAAVNASYAMLPPAQQAVLSPPSAAVMAALGPIGPIPTVGMNGLVPNARMLVAYIMATFPGVQSIGGVRADRLPDHPSGHAVDIMIGSDMGLGDAINADLQSQAGRFGVVYTMWRVADHFNHVHVTVR